jgi:acetoin:2,6-dichlorophenolindophenol oxidoreductase subunit beta
MSSNKRLISFSHAINEALYQMMEMDDSVFIIGQGVKSPWYVGNTAQGLISRFGEARVIDTPVSENAMTGAAVGAALAGMRAITVHPRLDFMLYAFDPIINEASNWFLMSGGKLSVPVVFWGIINRGGEQAAQHSQSIHAMFAHVPGLKVVMPSTPYDAKGLMIAAIKDNNPVIFIDERWLYNETGFVPEELYSVPIGKAAIRKEGKDITIIASSFLSNQAVKAALLLDKRGIDAEVIDLRSIKPIDETTIVESVTKTGRLLVVDGGWRSFGVSAEIAATISEKTFDKLKLPIKRLALPDIPAPMSRPLENKYYLSYNDIFIEAQKLLET